MNDTLFLSHEKILIHNGKVFIDGVETNNPELIGYAILDYAETKQFNESDIRLKYQRYIDTKDGLRHTYEKKCLLDLLLSIKTDKTDFKPIDFVNMGFLKYNITRATAYSFLNSCVEAGILFTTERTYNFN